MDFVRGQRRDAPGQWWGEGREKGGVEPEFHPVCICQRGVIPFTESYVIRFTVKVTSEGRAREELRRVVGVTVALI